MDKFRKECVEAHNRYRKIHGVPPLRLDPKVNSEAQKWALHCVFAEEEGISEVGWTFNDSNAYAETIHVSQDFLSGTELVEEFYQQEKDYVYDSEEYNPLTAQFTNMIWKGSTKMGIGRAENVSGKVYVVINYSPGGKPNEHFRANVFPPGTKNVVAKIKSEVGTKLDKFTQECVDAHNYYRKKHGVPPLVIDTQVTRDAQRYAEHCARCNKMEYQDSNEESTYEYTNYDVRIYNGCHSNHGYLSGTKLVKEFYKEGIDYCYGSTEDQSAGNFPNMIWKSSTKIGVGRAKAPSGNVFVVVNYYPGEAQDNLSGEYEFNAEEYNANVLPPIEEHESSEIKEEVEEEDDEWEDIEDEEDEEEERAKDNASKNSSKEITKKENQLVAKPEEKKETVVTKPEEKETVVVAKPVEETVVVAKPAEKKETIKVDVNSKFDSFSRECLDAHNVYRKRHGSPPLVLSEWLMGVAQDWANNCASRGMMYHSNHPNDQENIYATSGRVANGREAVDCFYNEIKYYRFGSMGFTMQTGHFTQVVWKSTTMMGVGKATGRNGWTYVIVSYSPRGNMQGHFSANVLPPRS